MTKFHCCLDIQGFLEMNKERPLSFFNGMAKEDGKPLSGPEFIANLQNHLNQGHKVIPIGHCDDFDYRTGCPGHPDEGGAR